MFSAERSLKSRLRAWTLFLGVLQITVGCLLGLIPPTLVPWYRGLLMAHLEFTANGVLLIVFGFLASELALGPKSLRTWFVLLQLGTWTNGASGLVASLLGRSSNLITTINQKFPPPQGTDSSLVTGLLVFCAVTTLAALGLTLVGLWPSLRGRQTAEGRGTAQA